MWAWPSLPECINWIWNLSRCLVKPLKYSLLLSLECAHQSWSSTSGFAKNAFILNVSWNFIYILINHCSNIEEDSELMQHVMEWFYLLQELSNCSCDDCGYGNLLLGAFTLQIRTSLIDRERYHFLITEVLQVL